jgi:hypothetical protein
MCVVSSRARFCVANAQMQRVAVKESSTPSGLKAYNEGLTNPGTAGNFFCIPCLAWDGQPPDHPGKAMTAAARLPPLLLPCPDFGQTKFPTGSCCRSVRR